MICPMCENLTIPTCLRAVGRPPDEACRGLVEASLRLRQLALHLFLDRFCSIRVHVRVVLYRETRRQNAHIRQRVHRMVIAWRKSERHLLHASRRGDLTLHGALSNVTTVVIGERGCTNAMHGRSRVTLRPSHPYHAGTERVEFSPTRQTLLRRGGREYLLNETKNTFSFLV